MRALALLLILPVTLGGYAGGRPSFDFRHVRMSLDYFADPNDERLASIAQLDATRHFQAHSEFSGYFGPDVGATEMTKLLLAKVPTHEEAEQTRALIAYAGADPKRQRTCLHAADRFLPSNARHGTHLFATWGYDIGVASPLGVSLNFAHRHFREAPEEIWFYCTHEAHHAGVYRLHPFPKLSDIKTVGALVRLIRYATFLEGSAVFAVRDVRAKADALEQDEDYRALKDRVRMNRISARFDKILSRLEHRNPNDTLTDADWAIIDEMSSGERLWYRHGARMAAAIYTDRGAGGFRSIIAGGPDAFFDAYNKLR